MLAPTKQKLTKQVLALSRDDRADVAAVILDSFRGEDVPIDPEIEATWIAEAEERIAACEKGISKNVPLEEVSRKLKQRYDK